jgi:integrase
VSYSYDLSFWAIEKRDRPKPYRVRWSVAGRRPPFSRSFLTSELAESFKADLKAAARRGESFDEATGLPDSVLRRDRDITWYQHAQEYAAARWIRSAGNTRKSIIESLICVTQVLTRELRGRPDSGTLRGALRKDLNQGRGKSYLSAEESRAIAWVKRASLPVSVLNDDDVVIEVLDALASRLDGTAAAPEYYARRFRAIRACLSYAVRKKRLPKNPFLAANLPGDWRPPKADDAVDPRSVGSPQLVADMLTVATYVGVRQGPRFAAFFGCMFYGLMRPAEVARLTKASCYLPEKGWGVLTFGDSAPAPGREWTDSGDVHEERGLKGRSRRAVRKVPIPPELIHLLREHVERFGTAPDGRLFRSERGGLIQPSTWWQVWRKVRSLSLTPDQLVTPLMERPYDLRHAGITWRLNSGVPAPDVAKWAGHSVEVLTRIYAGCVVGLDEVWIARMTAGLRPGHLASGDGSGGVQ